MQSIVRGTLVRLAALWLTMSAAQADVSPLISYQAMLTDQSGIPLDTTVGMTFALYDDSTGGTPVWSETQATVAVSDGLLNVCLGRVNPLEATHFSSAGCWLGIRIGSGDELQPRTPMLSVPYAFRVGSIDQAKAGTIWGDLVVTDQATIGIENYNPAKGTFCAGAANTPLEDYSVVAGGYDNYAYNSYAAVLGGTANIAAGLYSAVPGGKGNQAAGLISIAFGNNAQAIHAGSIAMAANDCDT